MSFMLLTSRAILPNFFGNIHLNHDQLCIKKTHILLYFFATFSDIWNVYF
jgi:hypothetical protein